MYNKNTLKEYFEILKDSEKRGAFKMNIKNKFNKFLVWIQKMLMIIGILTTACMVLGVGLWFTKDKVKETGTEENDVTVTRVMVQEDIKLIGEIHTCKFEYEGYDEIISHRKLWNVNVPLTSHEIWFAYKGIIRAGFQIDEINIAVDNLKKVISITIPEVQIFGNEADVIECKQDNNIFNPIEGDEVNQALSAIKKEELERAIYEKDILSQTKAQLENLIMLQLEEYTDLGYEIKIK